MRQINLLDLIHRGNTRKPSGEAIVGKLNDSRIIGYVGNSVSDEYMPGYLLRLQKADSRLKWAVMTLFAYTDLKELKKSKNSYGFVYGSLLVLMPLNAPLNDWYQVDGNIRTVLFDGTGNQCYISNMLKRGDKWCVTPFEFGDVDVDSLPKIISDYIEKSCELGVLMQPNMSNNIEQLEALGKIASKKLNVLTYTTPESNGITIKETENSEPISVNNVEEIIKKVAEPTKKVLEEKQESLEEGFLDVDKVNKFDINKRPSASIQYPDGKTGRVPKLKVQNRKDKEKLTYKFYSLKEISKESKLIREKNLKEVVDTYSITKEEMASTSKDALIDLIDKIKLNDNRKPLGIGMTGNAIIKEFIYASPESSKSCMNTTLGDVILNNGIDRICDYILRVNGCINERIVLDVPIDNQTKESMTKIFRGIQDLDYSILYAIITKTRVNDLLETATACSLAKVSFVKIAETNPYLFILLNNDLKFLTLETLANARGCNQINEEWRLACMLHEMLLSYNGSTAFDMRDLAKDGLSYSIGIRGMNKIKSSKSLVNDEVKANLKAYINENLSNRDWNYEASAFNDYGKKTLSRAELKQAIEAYVDTGLGTSFKGVLYNTQMMDREITMFEKLNRMCRKDKNIDKDLIEKCIIEFEEIKTKELGFQFKLEEEQKEAARAIDNTILIVTGQAGSGKTTTSELMIYCYKKHPRYKDTEISYAAPTGKAAKRLQEVVGTTVKTMHSKFKVFGNAKAELTDFTDNGFNNSVGDNILVLDEQAMTDINLMSKAIDSVDENTKIWFLGDVKQLCPVGFGKPFADMLRFFPTIKLGVSKRAAENSTINKNGLYITDYSERDNFVPVVNGEDFRLRNCADNEIQKVITSICKYHLGLINLAPEDVVTNLKEVNQNDIQVISPVTKDRYSWGSEKLNTMLQDLFNPIQMIKNFSVTYGFSDNLKEVRIGSRVVHMSNNYGKRHFSSIKGGSFKMTNKAGIMNGDVGYIEAIYDGHMCSDIEPDEGKEDVFEDHDIVDIDKFYTQDNVIIAVRYYDSEIKDDYFVLYKGLKVQSASTPYQIVLSYTDLDELQLAYCLSTHKMQGSQAKLVIYCMGTGMKPEFANMNMFYTAISRGQKAVYLVGNIGAMERGRYYEATSAIHTVMEEICCVY